MLLCHSLFSYRKVCCVHVCSVLFWLYYPFQSWDYFRPRHKHFWKTSKPCHVGIHQIALTEFSQMSTHLPGFRSFSVVFSSLCIAKLATCSIRVMVYMYSGFSCWVLGALIADVFCLSLSYFHFVQKCPCACFKFSLFWCSSASDIPLTFLYFWFGLW